MVTDRDMREQVIATLDGDDTEHNVDAIVAEIQRTYGTVDISAVPHVRYWDIVARHAR
jgi:hypothetical protein